MSDEEALVEGGPTSIIRAIDGDDTLNADAMAMACARRARAASASRELALQWARASIACYRKAAEARAPWYDR